jgi:hypothetical protein
LCEHTLDHGDEIEFVREDCQGHHEDHAKEGVNVDKGPNNGHNSEQTII